METHLPSSGTNTLRPVLLGVLGVVVVGAAAGLILHNRATVTPASAPAAQVAAKSPAAAEPAPSVAKPSFDIVRVNPTGDAVMAGRAAPGAKVIISDDGKQIGQAQADQSGDWVFVPSTPLTPGARTLTLTEQAPNGAEAKSDRSVVLVVPETAAGKPAQAVPPLAVLTGPNVAPSVLTGPPAADNGAGQARLAVNAAEYGEHGNLRVAGIAPPGSTVRVYMDDKPVGQAVTGQDGKWNLSDAYGLGAGDHHMRIDRLAADGTVAARIEQMFSRQELELAAGKITIEHGQNLWTIARKTYGHGVRYLVIFQANRKAIRDPNLIYPGQVFALPVSSAAPAMPASSSKSK
jgi:nucleoid-associated protein YgaU